MTSKISHSNVVWVILTTFGNGRYPPCHILLIEEAAFLSMMLPSSVEVGFYLAPETGVWVDECNIVNQIDYFFVDERYVLL